jgi:hypothetical protein
VTFLLPYQARIFARIFAAPTSSSSDTDIPSSTTIHRNTTATNTRIHGSSVHLTPRPTHTPKLTFAPQPTFTQHHPPVTKPSNTSDSSKFSHGHLSHSLVTIIFAVLGGVVGFGFFLCLIRFLHNYSKTPPPDRITGVVNRYQLQRELEELERNPLRRASLREPPPPYFPRPPSYSARPSSYAEIVTVTGSPSVVPIASRRSLNAPAINNPLPNG